MTRALFIAALLIGTLTAGCAARFDFERGGWRISGELKPTQPNADILSSTN